MGQHYEYGTTPLSDFPVPMNNDPYGDNSQDPDESNGKNLDILSYYSIFMHNNFDKCF